MIKETKIAKGITATRAKAIATKSNSVGANSHRTKAAVQGAEDEDEERFQLEARN